MKTANLVVLISLALSLLGCATPRAALDQANNGVALVAQLEQELKEFRRVQEGFSEQAKKSIRELEAAAVSADSDTAASMRVRRAAEDPDGPRLYDLLRGLADGVGADASALTIQIAAVDDRLSKILKPLPSSTDKLSGVQKALAAMGAELSSKDRFGEIQAFIKLIKANVDSNKQKIKDAENSK